jgi:alcohol dehydrogenase class IV
MIKEILLYKKQFKISTKIIFSKNFLDNLQINKNTLYIKNRNLNLDLDKKIKKKFGKNIKKIIIKPMGEPSSKMVNKYSHKSYFNSIEQILVIGGGSTIDFAKGISVKNPKKKIEYHEFKNNISACIPITCIPTTCGSGADISPYCVVNNSKSKRKFTIKDKKLIPFETYIYPKVLSYINKKYIFSSLFDAFSHCLEIYLNKKQEVKLKQLALKGVRLGIKLLESKISRKNYIKYMLLSFYGGICLLKSRTSIIHTCSVAYAKYVNLPHGLLNLFLTSAGVRFNYKFLKKEITEIEKNIKEENFNEWLDKIEYNNKKSMKFIRKKIKINLILNRIKQDKTLKKVCYRKINNKNLL